MFNLYNNKVASLDINTEVERFQFVPKRFKGELRFPDNQEGGLMNRVWTYQAWFHLWREYQMVGFP